MAGSGVGATGQGKCAEGAHGGAVAGGHGADGKVDRRALADECAGLCESSAVSRAAEAMRKSQMV